MQTDNLVTVIIPTYNRSRELARLLHFLSVFDQRYRILVLDGGSEESRRANQRACAGYKNVEHHEFDSSLHLGMRICHGLELVTSPYVLMCGDDDFFFPDGVDDCVNFLEHNPDHAAAIGQVWTLNYFPDNPRLAGCIMLGNDLSAGNRFDHERFVLRSLFYFAYTLIGSIPLFYAVRRTDQTLKAFSLMTPNIKYSSMELLTNGMLLIDGKVAQLDTPFGLRDYGSITTRDPEREGTDLYIPVEDQNHIKPLLVDALMTKEGLDPALAQYLIESLLSIWANKKTSGESAPVAPEPRWQRQLRSARTYLQCWTGRFFPAAMAQLAGLDEKTFRAVLESHQRFTARRS